MGVSEDYFMKTSFQFSEIDVFSKTLFQSLQLGNIVFLYGDMGVGKTTLIRSICQWFHCDNLVCSPTFGLVNIYEGTTRIYHMDLYRLTRKFQLLDLDLERYFSDKNAITFVEWPDRLGDFCLDNVLVWEMDFLPEKGSDFRSFHCL